MTPYDRARRAEGRLLGVGQVELQYRTWEVPDARAGILVVHGLGEHSGRYERFGASMAAGGYSTYAFDLRGHGASEGRRGHVGSFDVFLQDLDRFRREVEALTDRRLPLFLLGQSMGGLIALRYQQEYRTRLAGAIILAPWLATAMSVPRWKVMAAAAASRILPALPFSAGIDAADLSHDPHVVEAYRADVLVHNRITPRLFVQASVAMGLVLQRADQFRAPLLFLIPGDDRVVDSQRALQLARMLPAELTTIRSYPGMFHEPLNEVDRHLVLRDIRNWVAAQVV